jgi:outer membrane protein assembly factor BamB
VPRVLITATILFVTLTAGPAALDWPNWRGPALDGTSAERGLPERWSPEGENLAWTAPYGGRSAPVAFGTRVYLQNTSGRSTNWDEADDVQERVMAFDAATGSVAWEHRFSVGLTDVPPHRVGWASPTVDPETGAVYAFGVAGRLLALSPDGTLLWERALVEEFGAVTTHGGRTVTPLVEGDLVIVNTLLTAWGPWTRGGNRYLAFDKRTGQTVWVATPQVRHYDTNYAMPVPVTIDGQRLLIVGGTDGAWHALRATTGEPLWRWDVSKRAINTAVVMHGSTAILTHSEENLGTNEMGMVAAVNLPTRGEIGPEQIKWRTLGWLAGFSSPVIDGGRLYSVDNGAVLGAFDLDTGRRLWTHTLGTIQKGSLVAGDGKLYVGTENGKVFILRPRADGVDVLDEVQLGTARDPEQIIGSPAIAHGRVYVASDRALYAIGPKTIAAGTASAPGGAPTREGRDRAAVEQGTGAPTAGPAATVQVVPLEALLEPGEPLRLSLRVFDAQGRRLAAPAPDAVTWSLDGLQGALGADGTFTPPAGSGAQAGAVKATVAGVSGTGHVRVIPPLPWTVDFEDSPGEAPPSHWINAAGKFVVREVDGTRALMRVEDVTVTRRARLFMGPHTLSDYVVEVDVRSPERRRQLGDVGVFAQQYGLILFGNSQRLELHPWQTARAMTVAAPFAWKGETWYRLKLRVENRDDGTTRVQGKVWAREDAEPDGWLVEKIDTVPHRQGSPGLYADAPLGAYFDNITVTPIEGRPGS